MRNYLTGALLYLCQRGRDKAIKEELLYQGTSKAAEGYGTHLTFKGVGDAH